PLRTVGVDAQVSTEQSVEAVRDVGGDRDQRHYRHPRVEATGAAHGSTTDLGRGLPDDDLLRLHDLLHPRASLHLMRWDACVGAQVRSGRRAVSSVELVETTRRLSPAWATAVPS